MPLSTFLPDVGAVKWQASVSADMPMCNGCLHVNILPLRLFCSERKEQGTKAHVKTSQWAMPTTCPKPKRSYD
jgi:hypothetical protein